MRIIKPGFEIVEVNQSSLKLIEKMGRICYKSEDKITDDSAPTFVKGLLKRVHEAVIEHSMMSVVFTVDRGISHELVRHRMCAFCQESTRYCNYSKGKFGSEITVIDPWFYKSDPVRYDRWKQAMADAESHYLFLMEGGGKAQDARSVLPNSLKTEIGVTANFREWRHIFRMRTPNAAHPQMREVMIPLLRAAQKKVPVVFDDIIPDSDKSLTDYLDATNSWNEIGEYGLNNDIVSLDYMVLDKQK